MKSAHSAAAVPRETIPRRRTTHLYVSRRASARLATRGKSKGSKNKGSVPTWKGPVWAKLLDDTASLLFRGVLRTAGKEGRFRPDHNSREHPARLPTKNQPR